jgi:hypothetical protein
LHGAPRSPDVANRKILFIAGLLLHHRAGPFGYRRSKADGSDRDPSQHLDR